jgi:hypothetical protein
MRLELVSCVRVFGNDSRRHRQPGDLDLDGAPTPLGTSCDCRWSTPTARSRRTRPAMRSPATAVLHQAGVERSVRVHQRATSTWSTCIVGSTTTRPRKKGGPKVGSSIGLNLVRLVSEPLIDGSAIDGITNPTTRSRCCCTSHDGTPDANLATPMRRARSSGCAAVRRPWSGRSARSILPTAS